MIGSKTNLNDVHCLHRQPQPMTIILKSVSSLDTSFSEVRAMQRQSAQSSELSPEEHIAISPMSNDIQPRAAPSHWELRAEAGHQPGSDPLCCRL